MEEIAKAMNDLKTEQYENKTVTNNIDIESNHRYADRLLCAMLVELGCEDFVDDYRQIQKWYA
jgi:hypothetical protein